MRIFEVPLKDIWDKLDNERKYPHAQVDGGNKSFPM
jgi:hypothetical protein